MPWEAKLYASRVVQKLREYPDKVQQALEEAWPQITETMLEDVLSRTPSPEDEYEMLMGGQGVADTAVDPPPLSGGESDDPDKPRTRFIRDPGYWLEELVTMEGVGFTSNAGALTIQLGNSTLLEEMSKFSWTDVFGRRVYWGKVINEGEEMTHTSAYGTWSFFEYGTEPPGHPHGVGPKFGDYWLNPDGDHDHRVPYMTKSYPALRMFSGYNRALFKNAVRDVIREVEF